MNTLVKTLGIAGIVLGIYGCNPENKSDSTTRVENDGPRYEMLIGRPLSVEGSVANTHCPLSIVLKLGEKKILTNFGIVNFNTIHMEKYVNIVSLIQSEISDGDNESIKLVGKYRKDEFGNHIFGFNEIYIENYHFKLED